MAIERARQVGTPFWASGEGKVHRRRLPRGGVQSAEGDAGEGAVERRKLKLELPARHTATQQSSWTRRRHRTATGGGGPRGGAHGRS
jgi:hypothetical protein